ncbi:egalitarian protein homolog [Tubulanus polymorphus]|uniref:egalitarian protein homolog n=1 Tax=Tubulanus polymorphus TaxID=672921 RepID=UPI003DA6118A
MGKPLVVLVTTVAAARQVVNDILTKEREPVIGVACKRTFYNGPLMLLMISTYSGKIYEFDIKQNPELIIEGRIIRLLQAVDLIKVFHDVRRDNRALFQQYGIRVQNVFDTQIAYAVLMKDASLSPRFISVYNLYMKYCRHGNDSDVIEKHLLDEPNDTELFWARRPLNATMVTHSAISAAALVPGIYEAMKRELRPESVEVFEILCNEVLRLKPSVCRPTSEKPPTTQSFRPPITKFTRQQVALLKKTATNSNTDYI